MPKKISFFSIFLCFAHLSAINLTPRIEIKPSYFMFTSPPLKQVYHKGGFEIQGSATGSLCSYLKTYGSIGYRKAWGHALNTGEKTNLTIIPFDLGLKPLFKLDEQFDYFFAIGPRFFYFFQHNQSLYVNPKVKGGGVGFFVNTGCNAQLTDSFLLGVFGEYSYEKKTITSQQINVFSNGNVQLGGFAVGISIGHLF